MNQAMSILLSRHNRDDVAEMLRFYEQELDLSFRACFVDDGLRIYCFTLNGGIYPTVLIPLGADKDQTGSGTDRIVKGILELLGEVNADFNTSPSKLKMKKELQGR